MSMSYKERIEQQTEEHNAFFESDRQGILISFVREEEGENSNVSMSSTVNNMDRDTMIYAITDLVRKMTKREGVDLVHILSAIEARHEDIIEEEEEDNA